MASHETKKFRKRLKMDTTENRNILINGCNRRMLDVHVKELHIEKLERFFREKPKKESNDILHAYEKLKELEKDLDALKRKSLGYQRDSLAHVRKELNMIRNIARDLNEIKKQIPK